MNEFRQDVRERRERHDFVNLAVAAAGAAIGISLALWLAGGRNSPFLLASLGGSTVFLFALSHTDAAQPRALFGGHIGGSIIGIICFQLFGDALWVSVVAVVLTMIFMVVTRTIHPPAWPRVTRHPGGNMKYRYWAVVILILLNGRVAGAQDPPNVRMLNDVVVTYMTAFNRGDFEEAVSLMHPQAVRNMSRMFMDAYGQAISEGREMEFRNTIDIDKSLSELKGMDDRDVDVYLLKCNRLAARKGDPAAAEKLARAVVRPSAAEKVSDSSYKVKFVMVQPEDNNSILMEGESLVKKINGTWRVYR